MSLCGFASIGRAKAAIDWVSKWAARQKEGANAAMGIADWSSALGAWCACVIAKRFLDDFKSKMGGDLSSGEYDLMSSAINAAMSHMRGETNREDVRQSIRNMYSGEDRGRGYIHATNPMKSAVMHASHGAVNAMQFVDDAPHEMPSSLGTTMSDTVDVVVAQVVLAMYETTNQRFLFTNIRSPQDAEKHKDKLRDAEFAKIKSMVVEACRTFPIGSLEFSCGRWRRPPKKPSGAIEPPMAAMSATVGVVAGAAAVAIAKKLRSA